MDFAVCPAALSPHEIKFTQLLSNYPKLCLYWNFEERECDIDSIKRELIGMKVCLNEKIMLRFFVMVWVGVDVLNFSMIDAVKMLDKQDLQHILAWINDPYYP